jgi:hypothetical protein
MAEYAEVNKLLDKISPREALEILRALAKTDKQVKKKILELAELMIKDINFESISDDVFWALDRIDVHDLWNRSGASVDGYNSPEEMAFEMIEEKIEPFQQKILRLIGLGLNEEAKLFCMSVLKGLYMYDHDSDSEFRNWATDIPGELFSTLLDEWKKRLRNKLDIKEMDAFIKKECEDWSN